MARPDSLNHQALPFRVRAELFTQLAHLETAGLPPNQAFAMIKLGREAKPRIAAMRIQLTTSTLPVAGEQSGLFTHLEAQLVSAALAAGSPAKMYKRLADVYTKRAMQTTIVKSQLSLPAFVLLAVLFIAPFPGLIVGNYGFVGYFWAALRPLLVLAVIVYVLRWYLKKQSRQYLGPASGLLSLPIAGKLLIQRNNRDFFECLALLLEAGIPMLEALPIAVKTLTQASIRKDFARLLPSVKDGATLSQAMNKLRYLGEFDSRRRAIGFVQTGEASGTLPEMLHRHVANVTQKIEQTVAQLATWVPRLVYGLVVMWMVYSILSGPGVASRMPEGL
jgi:type II secretory pathway component PulF